MDDLIELVARTLAAADGYDPEVFLESIPWRSYTDNAQAILDAINRENVVVPRVATDGMLGKGGEALAITVQWQDSYETDADNCYEAMLRASPYYVEIQG